MGSKNPTSQTTQQVKIPAWLDGIMQNLMTQSAGNMANFGAQGNAVLQGQDYKSVPQVTPEQMRAGGATSSNYLDQDLLRQYYASRGGNS